ncbi:hypothetical protein AMES_4682 [Amycolatopsis mediterranei S699]|uniref:PLAT domain-containing protein n=4 Tax=Amycolatopsis mediterranei TaxID=33910 RepID=A0A0H3D867_AMYMU|nr:hypothetical protein AMED_4741 [Amycolatopsis mediterranei U32]AEK43307.1 hypothetical protein RAM_24135 [Amycolatopsis mediterranei S699]AGT85346.1 hypothetical protein B737_4682 [Amycolatopsis mediterranei RB]KDO06400.1 hypothetical protein DV26_33555 [Amycolatopsis mediterranei]AFO78218.1 hypothetical protein AMES_4682 [Amycolatopsis mediterranei S699]
MKPFFCHTNRPIGVVFKVAVVAGLPIIAMAMNSAPAQAAPGAATRGDAEAVLHASGTGGAAVRNHRTVSGASPADIDRRVSIRVLESVDGRHFCQDDWHVILVAETSGGDKSFTVQEAKAEADAVRLEFFLDGSPLATERTSVKRSLDPGFFGWEEAYFFQQGAIMAPGDLTVGAHSLRVVATDPAGSGQNEITVWIDATGTGVCS